jgi:hypothetical protein
VPAGLFLLFAFMDEIRKNAYRYLIYHGLQTIRKPFYGGAPASKLTEEQCRQFVNYAGPVGYLLHNLALLSAEDFDKFNEEYFWQGFERFSQLYPEIDVSHFRRVFESQLLSFS